MFCSRIEKHATGGTQQQQQKQRSELGPDIGFALNLFCVRLSVLLLLVFGLTYGALLRCQLDASAAIRPTALI